MAQSSLKLAREEYNRRRTEAGGQSKQHALSMRAGAENNSETKKAADPGGKLSVAEILTRCRDAGFPDKYLTTGAVIDFGPSSCHVAAMQLLEELRAEHDLIDQMLDSFRTAVSQFVGAQSGPQDLVRFVRFFRVYADQFHHSREEQVLFATLANQLHLPGDHGPIAVLTDDHRQFKAWLDQIEQLIAKQPLSLADQIQLRTTTEQYIAAMQHHIDAENSVLFVEGEICLQDAGIPELPSRSLTADEQQVRLLAEELLQRYPPTPNVEVIRGDGCVMCPVYQKTCDGYEREWSKASRWGHAEDDDPFSDG